RTTLLGALVAAASATDRCVVVERRRELGRALPGITAIDAASDGRRALDIALRLRPQRVVVGDADESVASPLVSLLGTGTEGLLLSIEGPSPAIALSQWAARAAGSGLSRDEALSRITATRPVVVQLARLGDGHCRVVSIGEANPAEGGIQVDEIFTLQI